MRNICYLKFKDNVDGNLQKNFKLGLSRLLIGVTETNDNRII